MDPIMKVALNLFENMIREKVDIDEMQFSFVP